jgi:hypothetical protein
MHFSCPFSALPLCRKQAVDEWIGSNEKNPVEDLGEDRSKWVKCSICGQPNRYVFYICNIFNGNFLNVGSDCIKYFGVRVDRNGRSIDQLIKNAKRVRRLAELDSRIPGIDNIVTEWHHCLEEFPIVLPSKLENQYLELGNKLKKVYEMYLNEEEKRVEEIADTITKLLTQKDNILKQIEAHIEKHKEQDFVATKELVRWLETNGKHSVVQMIKEDGGKIKWRTVHRIEEPRLMNLILKKLGPHFQRIGAALIRADIEQGRYIWQPLWGPKLALSCKHSTLLLRYGGLLFNEILDKPLTRQALVEISEFYGETSLDLAIAELFSKLQGTDFRLWGYNLNYNEVVFLNLKQHNYIILPMIDFLSTFKGLVLNTDNKSTSDIVNYVVKSGKAPCSFEDINEQQRLRREPYIILR